jgi:hypothetical protein
MRQPDWGHHSQAFVDEAESMESLLDERAVPCNDAKIVFMEAGFSTTASNMDVIGNPRQKCPNVVQPMALAEGRELASLRSDPSIAIPPQSGNSKSMM